MLELRHRARRAVDPNRLLLKEYNLTVGERVDMFVRGIILLELAIPIGSAIYFILSQTGLRWSYPKQNYTFFWAYLGNVWDRLPLYVDTLFNKPWFAPLGTHVVPHTWVIARHDARHVIIGFIAALLIGAITIGLKERKRASTLYMVMSVPASFVVAMVVAAGLIAFFARVTPVLDHVGLATSNTWVEGQIGKGSLQLFAIGFIAGFCAKLVLKRTFDTMQLMSIERNLAQKQDQEQWWWHIVYTPVYIKRLERLRDEGHVAEKHSRWLGMTLTLGAPVLAFLLGFGIWVLHFSFAAGVH